MNHRFSALLLCSCALTICGCSPWLQSTASEQALPMPLLAPDTVVVEVAFVHLTPDDHALEAAIWNQLDEQRLAIETRQQLMGNGIRAGLAGTQLPNELRQLVERTADQNSQAPSGDDVTTAETSTLTRQRRMQLRSGRRGKVVITTTLPAISILSKDEQGHVQGDAFREAQCLFSLHANPHSDGRTQLQLTPEIEHGDLKNRWVPIDGSLVHQVGKDRKVYQHLRIDLPLVAGQTLVIGPTEASSGLGQHFFTSAAPTPRRTMLLIRMAQTQQDELFQKSERSEVLASISD